MPTMPKKPVDTQIETGPFQKAMPRKVICVSQYEVLVLAAIANFQPAPCQPLLGQYTNRELSFADLQQAAAVITDYYRKAGFLFAYAYFTRTNPEHGQVDWLFLKGRRRISRFLLQHYSYPTKTSL